MGFALSRRLKNGLNFLAGKTLRVIFLWSSTSNNLKVLTGELLRVDMLGLERICRFLLYLISLQRHIRIRVLVQLVRKKHNHNTDMFRLNDKYYKTIEHQLTKNSMGWKPIHSFSSYKPSYKINRPLYGNKD